MAINRSFPIPDYTIGYQKSPTRSEYQLVQIKLSNVQIQFFISLELQN